MTDDRISEIWATIPTQNDPTGRKFALAFGRALLKACGDVVVTRTPDNTIIAVTRQDEEGRILKVIAEA